MKQLFLGFCIFLIFFCGFQLMESLLKPKIKPSPPPKTHRRGGQDFVSRLPWFFFFCIVPFLSFFLCFCWLPGWARVAAAQPSVAHQWACCCGVFSLGAGLASWTDIHPTDIHTVWHCSKITSNNCWYEDIITMSGWAPQYLLVFIIILPLLDLCFWTLCLLIYLTHLVLNEPHCQICKASLLSYCWLPLGGGLHLVQNWPVGLLVAPAQERRENFISSAEREKLQEKCVYFEILPNFGSCGKLRLSIAALLQRFVWWL